MRTHPDLVRAPLIIDLTGAGPAPVLLRWPADEERRRLLAERGVPRLFLVDGGAAPPVCADPLEDWIRVPCEERDLEARKREGSARAPAATPETPPRLDGNGRLLRGGRWVPLSPIEERLCRLLIGEFDAVVSDRRLMAGAWPGGSGTSTGLRLQVTRLRRRVADLGLEIRSVRGKGYVLQNGSTSGAVSQ